MASNCTLQIAPPIQFDSGSRWKLSDCIKEPYLACERRPVKLPFDNYSPRYIPIEASELQYAY